MPEDEQNTKNDRDLRVLRPRHLLLGCVNVLHPRPRLQSKKVCTALLHGQRFVHRWVSSSKSDGAVVSNFPLQCLIHDRLQDDASVDVLQAEAGNLHHLLAESDPHFVLCDVGQKHRLDGRLRRHSNYITRVHAVRSRAERLRHRFQAVRIDV